MTTAVLEVRDLVVHRNGAQPVLEVDRLSVSEGEVLAVIGPNGSGKTTLLLTLSQLLKPTQGEIYYRGRPLSSRQGLAYRRRIGLILQDPLLLDLSVFDNVAAGMRFRRMPKKIIEARVNRWLYRLGISHLMQRPARSLSGGEAQRTSLARALALDPEMLMLDEPFSALDSPTRRRLLEDFHALLAETAYTTVFVTHDLNEALLLGDRVAVLLDGRVRQVGPPDRVFSAPADTQVADFVGIETVILAKVLDSRYGIVTLKAQDWILEAAGEVAPNRTVYLCLRPEQVTIWKQENLPNSSARNRISGRITRMTNQGALLKVVLDCGFPIVALITRASADQMGLEIGQKVTATFKASAAHLIVR